VQLYNQFVPALLNKHSSHLPLLSLCLNYLLADPSRGSTEDIVGAATAVIDHVDRGQLTLHYGRQLNEQDDEAVKTRKEMDRLKTQIIDALAAKAQALITLINRAVPFDSSSLLITPSTGATLTQPTVVISAIDTKEVKDSTTSTAPSPSLAENKHAISFRDTMAEFRTWLDLKKKANASKYLPLLIHEQLLSSDGGNLGEALRLLNADSNRSDPHKENEALRSVVLRRLTQQRGGAGWMHVWELHQVCHVVDNPKDFRLF